MRLWRSGRPLVRPREEGTIKGKAVLITGGAGFIGSHLAEHYLQKGCRVVALDNLSTGSRANVQHLLANDRFRFELGSVLDAGLCRRLVEQAEVVVHLAASVGVRLVFDQPAETIENNIRGTENILAACVRSKRKVFVTSTSEVYGMDTHAADAKFHEDDPITLGVSMRWCYACSKAMDEYLARAYFQSKGLPVVIGRLFNTVGPRQTGAYGMVIPRFIEWALAGAPIQVYGDGKQRRTFVHVDDAVHAIGRLLEEDKAQGEIFNIGGLEPVTVGELAERIKALTGSRSKIVYIPYEKAFGPGFEDIKNRVPDLSKIQAAIGYRPAKSLDDILKETVAFCRQAQG